MNKPFIPDPRVETLREAITEANRFIRSATKAKDSLSNEPEGGNGNRAYAAAKRSSMDLTNALVAVRNPNGTR
ncbi:hypothetical protein J7481_03200 [Labrenzia sp. R4_2]|uniref:hypothetical protein n=1 Tax=Labrenzia sp. R4_2 TaxID=2821107 RepID=UPI001ADAFA05|nr:hypothetical protein [Labrenzia sp. R4_2]MBO9418490.1 hypothetical protein [Labrenzia sp. R4_2]